MNIFKEVSKWFQDFKAGFVYNNDVPPVLDTKPKQFGEVGHTISLSDLQERTGLDLSEFTKPCIDDDLDMYSYYKLEVFGYARKYKLKPQCQTVLLNLLYKGETRIEDYIDDNPRFDLNRRICDLREKGFSIKTVPLRIRGHGSVPCKFVFVGAPE